MAYADKILKSNLELVFRYGSTDINHNVRPRWDDGMPAYTLYATAVTNVYDIAKNGMPITTLRPVAWKTALKEILWIWQDNSNDVNLLKEKYNVHYWDSWKKEDGTLGMAYGATAAKYYDFPDTPYPMTQLQRVIHLIKTDPMNRRIMTNLIEFDHMKEYALTPCAYETIWSVRDGYLDMTLIQRSNDMVAAQSINAIQYAFLLQIVAAETGYRVGKLTHFIQNMHIYDRHLEFGRDLIMREEFPQPTFIFTKAENGIYTVDNFNFENYQTGPQIKNIPIAI